MCREDQIIHRDLVPILVIGGLGAIGAGAFGWVGIVRPEWLDWPNDKPIFVDFLLLILGCLPLLWLWALRLHLKAWWVYRNTSPKTIDLQLEIEKDSDCDRFHALLFSDSDDENVQRIMVYPPRGDAKVFTNRQKAHVFSDPKTGKPLVIEIGDQRLWSMEL